jgi:feruloyl esterase
VLHMSIGIYIYCGRAITQYLEDLMIYLKMKLAVLPHLISFITIGTTSLTTAASSSQLACSKEAFTRHISSTSYAHQTVVQWAHTVPKGGAFQVPASDIPYPQSPTDLPELCAVQINVTSSPHSAYAFGLFLPVEWNERFL